jgi:hypothetical protein
MPVKLSAKMTHYQILGLEPTASPDAIKQRFRELARQCHPDVTPDAPDSHQKFACIIEAYQLLADPMRRADYDQILQLGSPEGLTPELEVGTRLEVHHSAGLLLCSIREVSSRMLQLAAPSGARRSSAILEGTPVRLICHRAGRCLEAETMTGTWIWMRPPLFWVGPVNSWRENPRRRSRRVPYQLAVRLLVEGVGEYRGTTQDVSAAGVSLTMTGSAEICEGSAGRVSLQIGEPVWSADMPVRVVRVRNWLQPSRRTVEIGVQLESEPQCRRWMQYLARLGVVE